MELKRKRKTNRMLIAMVSIFVCCWLPLNVTLLTLDYWEELGDWRYFKMTFFIAHLCAMSSIVYNPFLYGWMNDNFRKEFKQVVPCLFACPVKGARGSDRATCAVAYSTVEQRTLLAAAPAACSPPLRKLSQPSCRLVPRVDSNGCTSAAGRSSSDSLRRHSDRCDATEPDALQAPIEQLVE